MPEARSKRGKHRRPPRVPRRQRAQQPGPPQPSAPGRVIVGEVRRPWGRFGELAATLYSGPESPIEPGWRIYLNGEQHTVADVREGGRGATVLQLEGVRSQHAAVELKDAVIEVDAADLPPPPEGTYYEYQLMGLCVRTVDGDELGTVVEIIETGSNDVYVVRPDKAGEPEVLIPATREVVREIDIDAGIINVDLPEGLV